MRRTRNAVYPMGIGGSNPSLSAKKESFIMNKCLTKLMPLMLILISCTKELNISDLKGEEGVAIHPDTGEPYSGKAYLNFFDGNIRMKGLYKDGKKSGDWKYYVQGSTERYYNIKFIDGQIASVNYNDGDEQWVGRPIMHKDSVIADGTYLAQTGDTEYNFNISPEVFVQMIDKTSHGRLTRWWGNGQVYSEGNYTYGKKQGKFSWWYESGKLKETRFWNDDKPAGITTQWFENGKKFAEGSYKKGMLHGQLIWWYEDGQKKEEVNFLQGERDGFAWWWYPDGGKKGVADISNGLGKITLFSKDGFYNSQYEVMENQIFCSSGEILFSIDQVSSDAPLPIGDNTCDCADCSDEPSK